MNCPSCNSAQTRKNGYRYGKQCYQCKHCGRQFVECYTRQGYSEDVKQLCLKMYLNGMGFRGIERVTGIDHTTIISWVKQAGASLPDAPQAEEIPEITEIDELETNVWNKKNKIWLWTVVNHWAPGILGWVLGDRSAETFKPICEYRALLAKFLVRDGWLYRLPLFY